jgi:hypothetical protein
VAEEDKVPAAFEGVPTEVEKKITQATGQDSLREQDVQGYFGGEGVATASNAGSAMTDVPEIAAGGEA